MTCSQPCDVNCSALWVCSVVVIERLRLRRLAWGDAGHLAALLKEFGCFNVIVGADVVYVEEALPLLLGSITTLLSQDPSVSLFPQRHLKARLFYTHHVLCFVSMHAALLERV